MASRTIVPLRLAFGDVLPGDWLAPVGGFLDKVVLDVGHSRTRWDHLGFRTEHRFYILEKARLDLPLVPGLAIELGEAGGFPTFVLSVVADPIFEVTVDEFPITLWMPPAILKSYTQDEDEAWQAAEDDGGAPIVGFPITVSSGIRANDRGDVDLLEPTFTVPFGAMIADTGVILDFRSDGPPPLDIVLGNVPERLRDDEDIPDDVKEALDGFKGVYIPRLVAHYVKPGTRVPPLSLAHAAIGSGGFSGTVAIGLPESADAEIREDVLEGYRDDPSTIPTTLVHADIEGMVCILQYFGITFAQSIPSASRVAGYLYMPFASRWIRLEAQVGGPDADLMLSLGGTDERPLIDLDTEWLEVQADELRYFLKDEVHWVGVKGSARPKIGDIQWPKFKLDELRISGDGDIEVDGGWIELPQQQVIDLGGFRVEIRALGFGREPAEPEATSQREWIGFSGGIKLVEGIPLSASVEGLKVSWDASVPGGDVDVSLKGVGVSLEIPGTLKLEGKVEYETLDGSPADGGLTGDLFRGRVALDLICLRTECEANLIIGKLTDAEGVTFDVAYVMIAAEFPAPVPLGATGAGLYGLKGLVGVNIAPDRQLADGEPEPWFEWYKARRDEAPPYSITHVDKWIPRRDAYAFGAGLTVGTVYDDGFTIHVGALVAVLLPGPVILIEGRGNLLKQRGDEQEGAFYALAVFDGNAGTFQLNLDIVYELDGILAVTGSVEAFFDFNDSTAWHVWLGQKTPESKRLGAQILTIISASSYLMLDNFGFVTGAKAGLELRESWGPVEVDLAALIIFEAGIFWNPLQLHGYLELLIELGLKIFGIGLELIIQLILEAKTPDPFWIHGVARVALKLPFPLPSFDVSVEFTWEEPGPPPLPVAPFLTAVEMTHHLSPSASWALSPTPEGAPVVPVDAVPLLSFGRPLAGRSLVARPDGGFEHAAGDVVDDRTFRYAVDRIVIVGDPGGADEHEVARYPVTDDLVHTPLDFSEDSILPDPTAQEPRWRLWSHRRRGGSTTYQREVPNPRAPACGNDPRTVSRCVDWSGVADGFLPAHTIWRGIGLRAEQPWRVDAGRLAYEHTAGGFWIELEQAVGELSLTVEGTASVIGFRRGAPAGELSRTDTSPRETFTLRDPQLVDADGDPDAARGIDAVWVREVVSTGRPNLALIRICTRSLEVMAAEARDRRERELPHRREREGGLMLRPDTLYQVEIDVATSTAVGDADPTRDITAGVYWLRTGRGPGTNPAEASFSGQLLDDLATYVESTMPEAGAAYAYRGLDVRVVFGEDYVPAMYRDDEELAIVVRDRNGRALGEPVALPLARFLERMNEETWTLLAHQRLDGCEGASLGDDSDAGIGELAWHADEPLGPRASYSAEVVVRRGDAAPVLHRFSFATSAYESPETQLRTALGDGGTTIVRAAGEADALSAASIDELRTAGSALAASRQSLRDLRDTGSMLAVLDARAACDEARARLATLAAERFAALASALGIDLVGRPLPPGVELVAVDIRASERRALLIESPEPIAFDRLSIDFQDGAGARTEVVAFPTRDRTRALLLALTGDGYFPRGGGRLALGETPSHAPELAPRTVAGAPYDMAIELPLPA